MISPNLPDAEFRKSSYSGTGNDCVEVATNLPDLIAIRDSKDPSGPVLAFSPTAWNNFLTGIRNGEI
ncbi:DUF397 domain-containing protein [Streptosporangium sp. NBC_01495]|uniref:DUF397 domain-containing protein n=1 Tax=Streptosporangium sp. NBC_01495 TaxID=2903899 RepID=UPI002E36B284|nr:DUF397 domain-containing protein [Streptosporangium sp. NBC_01495]